MGKKDFNVGDYAYFTRTPKQLMMPGVVTEITVYKIIQITHTNDGLKIYNTKHGAFNNTQIGCNVFYTKDEANSKIRRN